MPIDLDDTGGEWLEPDWSHRRDRVHNWRNHVPASIQGLWPTFTADQKLALYHHFEHLADSEEWD